MVEYGLLFALGFLTALLAGLFIAPAIHGRIVKFTEMRLKATVPMSAAELRAARDMDRARHAVENSRVTMDLKAERDRRAAVASKAEALQNDVAAMRGEIAGLNDQIETMSAEAGDLRSELRQQNEHAQTLKTALGESERGVASRDATIETMSVAARRMAIEVEDMKIDLATRDTEVESLRSSIEALSDERRRLREEVKTLGATVKDLEFRAQRDEGRSAALEKKLADARTSLSDQESTLERRNAETARLRERLKTANADMKEAERTLKALEGERAQLRAQLARNARMNGHASKDAEPARLIPADAAPPANADGQAALAASLDKGAIGQRVEKLRARHTALVDRLALAADDARGDQELRSEIKDIAATMVSLTAAREGKSSPIHALLAQDTDPDGTSLAARSIAMMREN